MTVGDVIFAVKVIACPTVDGFTDDVSAAALVVCSTVWFTTADVLLRLLMSPRYTAVIGYASAFRLDFVRVPTPALFRIALPIVYVCVKYLHTNTTVPVGGIGLAVVTRAVRVAF